MIKVMLAAMLALLPASAGAGPLPAPVALVQIHNNYFDPPEVHIDSGGTVGWFARAGGHTVTATDGSYGSPPIRSGDVLTRTFAEAGVYAYRCLTHQPRMTGVVVVG